MFASVWLVAAVLSSDDLCDDPQVSGKDNPDYCLLSEARTVQTPWFDVDVPAGVFVGVDSDGSRLQVESSVRQSRAGLRIEAYDSERRSEVLLRFGRCARVLSSDDTHMLCDHSSYGLTNLALLLYGSERPVVVTLAVTEPGGPELERYTLMLQSVSARLVGPSGHASEHAQ